MGAIGDAPTRAIRYTNTLFHYLWIYFFYAMNREFCSLRGDFQGKCCQFFLNMCHGLFHLSNCRKRLIGWTFDLVWWQRLLPYLVFLLSLFVFISNGYINIYISKIFLRLRASNCGKHLAIWYSTLVWLQSFLRLLEILNLMGCL